MFLIAQSKHRQTSTRTDTLSSSTLVMTQRLYLGHKSSYKLQPVNLYSLDHSTLYGASAPSRPTVQSEKGGSVAFDSAPPEHLQDDCPDGGLQAWLMVLGVRIRT